MICSIPGCGRPVRARGWCNKHWFRWYKKGDPLASRDYYRSRDYIADVVLPYPFNNCLLWPFGIGSHGYGAYADTTVPRFVCNAVYGPPPFPRAEAAHSCHVRACVNPRHLRWATRQQNEDDKLQIWAKRGRGSRKLDEIA
jgi:HNH endonuclease